MQYLEYKHTVINNLLISRLPMWTLWLNSLSAYYVQLLYIAIYLFPNLVSNRMITIIINFTHVTRFKMNINIIISSKKNNTCHIGWS